MRSVARNGTTKRSRTVGAVVFCVAVAALSGCATPAAAPSPSVDPTVAAARQAIATAMQGIGPVIVFQDAGLVQVASIDAPAGAPIAPDIPSGEQSHPAWSPDGQRIAFAHADETDGTIDIWIADLQGSAQRVVDCTAPCAYLDEPSWSPDGRYLAYERATRLTQDTGAYVIERYDVQTGETSTIWTATGNDGPYAPRWSGDGSTLVAEIATGISSSVDAPYDESTDFRIARTDVATGRRPTSSRPRRTRMTPT